MNKWIKYILMAYITIGVINALLLPPINIISLDNFLFPFAVFGVVYFYRNDRRFWLSSLLIGIIILTGLISNHVNDGLTIDEVLWLLRWCKLLVIGWATLFMVSENSKVFDNLILLSFVSMVIINAILLLNIDSVVELYEAKRELSVLTSNSLVDRRLSGTFMNPNNNGLVMALFGIYFLWSDSRWKYILASMAGVLILMSQSRTVFIAFLIVIIGSGLFKLFRRTRREFFYFLAGFIIFMLVIIKLKLPNLSSLFNGSAFQSNSIKIRYEIISKTIDVNKSSKLLGQGKLTNIPELLGSSIDSEYAYIYLEYGIIGLLCFAMLIIFLFIISYRCGKMPLAPFGLIVLMLICGLTNLSFTNIEVGPIFALLFAGTFVLSLSDKHEKIN